MAARTTASPVQETSLYGCLGLLLPNGDDLVEQVEQTIDLAQGALRTNLRLDELATKAGVAQSSLSSWRTTLAAFMIVDEQITIYQANRPRVIELLKEIRKTANALSMLTINTDVQDVDVDDFTPSLALLQHYIGSLINLFPEARAKRGQAAAENASRTQAQTPPRRPWEQMRHSESEPSNVPRQGSARGWSQTTGAGSSFRRPARTDTQFSNTSFDRSYSDIYAGGNARQVNGAVVRSDSTVDAIKETASYQGLYAEGNAFVINGIVYGDLPESPAQSPGPQSTPRSKPTSRKERHGS